MNRRSIVLPLAVAVGVLVALALAYVWLARRAGVESEGERVTRVLTASDRDMITALVAAWPTPGPAPTEPTTEAMAPGARLRAAWRARDQGDYAGCERAAILALRQDAATPEALTLLGECASKAEPASLGAARPLDRLLAILERVSPEPSLALVLLLEKNGREGAAASMLRQLVDSGGSAPARVLLAQDEVQALLLDSGARRRASPDSATLAPLLGAALDADAFAVLVARAKATGFLYAPLAEHARNGPAAAAVAIAYERWLGRPDGVVREATAALASGGDPLWLVTLALYAPLAGGDLSRLRQQVASGLLAGDLRTREAAGAAHAALSLHDGNPAEARRALLPLRAIASESSVTAVSAFVSLVEGNVALASAALDSAQAASPRPLEWLLVRALVDLQSGKEPADASARLGPIVPFAAAALANDKTDALHGDDLLDPLFGEADALCDANPLRAPLVREALMWLDTGLSRPGGSQARALLRGLGQAWLGRAGTRIAGAEGDLVLGLTAFTMAQPALAVRHLRRFAEAPRGDTSGVPLAWRGLYARALEQTDALAADEYWQRLAEDADAGTSAELHAARALLQRGEAQESYRRFRTIYLDGGDTGDVRRALAIAPGEAEDAEAHETQNTKEAP